MFPEERVPSVVEDYAKALYSLETRTDGAPVRTSVLAGRLGLSAPQVSLMCKRLAEMGLVTRSAYHGVQLTDEGRRVALQVLRHHRLLELFLAEALGMPWDRVHAEAEVLEHWVSDELEAAIAEKLGHPTVDPHGDPIPTADLVIDEGQTISLDALAAGEAGVFVRVSDSDPGMLRFLAEKGVVPGERLEVVEKQPFDGPVFLRRADDAEDLVLGVQLARAMRIELDPAGPERGGQPRS
ncbi:MAG TPA: metal-dependent transcriptional regulator [Solirubrobacteraceae bacterium]